MLTKPDKLLLILLTCGALSTAQAGVATTTLSQLRFAGDIQTALPADATTTLISADHTIIEFDLTTGFGEGANELGPLRHSQIDGHHAGGDGCGPALFSVDSFSEISGVTMRPADVFTASGTKILDADAEGVGDGINIDAVSRDPDTCDLVVSVNVYAQLDGTTYRPDDLIRWNSGSGFSLYRASNIDANIDALHLLDNGNTLFSLDSDHEISGLLIQDHDVIEQIPGGPGSFFELVFSPSAFNDSWDAADLIALWAQRQAMPGTVRWEQSTIEVFETDGSVSFSLERVNGTEGTINVGWTTIDGSATTGSDFFGGSGNLALTDGETSGGIVIPMINDMLTEGTESFTLRITTVSGGGTIGNPRELQVIIRDDEDFIFADGFED